MSRTPATVYRDLREAYLRYVDTAYWLHDPVLMAERRRLLEETDSLFTDVLMEPVVPYDATVELGSAAAEAGLPVRAAELVGEALFGSFRAPGEPITLREHQAEALIRSFRPGSDQGRNVVVTSGTGSGKTESFLLPVLARIVDECLALRPDPPTYQWWDTSPTRWTPSRRGAVRRPAMRSLILYPTNALVEDQNSRLRRAIRALAKLDSRARLWFGRYTGSTLGGGAFPTAGKGGPKVTEVAGELKSMAREIDRLATSGTAHEDLLAQFSDPRAGEMLTRWDMVATPPDVLVTNYSMLSAMLMRDLEEPLFDQTRAWVSSGGVFTLVVDELHLYRGTAGSEVAMIIRNLLNRLRLSPDSPSLRCIATSASLSSDASGAEFLQDFFGVPASSFYITAGRPRDLSGRIPVSVRQLLSASASGDMDVGRFASEADLPASVAEACRSNSGRIRATRLTEVAQRLFDEPDPEGEAMGTVLEALAQLEGKPGIIPFRAHMFARTMRGIWACSNPECDKVSSERNPKTVGRLFSIPTSTCDCGGRVLELLYCFECGDISLGGFVARNIDGTLLLTSSPIDVPASNAELVFRRPHGTYLWYRPGLVPPGDKWSHTAPTGHTVDLAFAQAHWDPYLGAATPGGSPGTGMVLTARGLPEEGNQRVPALPERCPRCRLRTGRFESSKFFRGIVRSPVRAHTSGLSQSTQLLLSQLHRSMGTTASESRTIRLHRLSR